MTQVTVVWAILYRLYRSNMMLSRRSKIVDLHCSAIITYRRPHPVHLGSPIWQEEVELYEG